MLKNNHRLIFAVFFVLLTGFLTGVGPFPAAPKNAVYRLQVMQETALRLENFEDYVVQRYGEFGITALNLLRSLGPNFKQLVVDPGIILNLNEFLNFAQRSGTENQDAWNMRERFSNSLGRDEVYRALILSPDEFNLIKGSGILSDALRSHQVSSFDNLSFAMEVLKRVKKNFLSTNPPVADRLLSVTSAPYIAQIVATSAASLKELGSKKLYLFKISLPKLDNLFFAKDSPAICSYEKRDSEIFRLYVGEQPTIRQRLCNAGLFPKEAESFVQLVIEPEEIIGYEEIDLTRDAILSAEKAVYRIIHKQSCDELDAMRDIVPEPYYQRTKASCIEENNN